MKLIEIPATDGQAEAYVARPASGEGPGVLFFIDAIGLRPQIAAMCDRIAAWGYVVLAPNVFYREGRAADLAPKRDLREPGAREEHFAGMGNRTSMGTDEIYPDLDHYVRALHELDGVRPGPIAVTVYCMGARLATHAAGRFGDGIAVVGGFHGGGLVTEKPDSPHLAVANASAEFVYGHAAQDRSMPPAAVDALGKALEDAGVEYSNEVYSDASHGFSMADTSMYDEAGAERSFEQLRAALGAAASGVSAKAPTDTSMCRPAPMAAGRQPGAPSSPSAASADAPGIRISKVSVTTV
ncbi:dienelactone hydrolase family protein [Calidifontibacter indicus]|uniref:dienelactone hydrolase family protein n=1 Tax=Calidifontibacter indicus TaxID=419650 RepID=UPI003D74829D